MAHFRSDCVSYLCSCNLYKPVWKMYFCRHCLKLRCGDCVSHEVDSHYCPNCLENMPSAEARLKKNRCANCFDCPSCEHTLSTRATSIQVPTPEDKTKTIPKKVYYLACGFCRWTSRDVGLQDQNVASGGWQELENPHVKRINSLLEHYRASAQQEKIEKERKKFIHRRTFVSYMEKSGVSSAVMRKQARLVPSFGSLSVKESDAKMAELIPAEASEDVESIDEDIFTKPLDLATVNTISQTLYQPEFQPHLANQMSPRHKHLLIRRSQRCRECEHNLSKPELNASSIKYKIQLNAYYHIPELRILPPLNLLADEKTQVVLTITNPTQNAIHVNLKNLPATDDDSLVEVPETEIIVSPRDDTAEFDDISDGYTHMDDPKVIAFRKANKVGVFVNLTPKPKDGKIKAALILRHDYLNTMPQAAQSDSKDPQIIWLEHSLGLNIGTDLA